MVRGIMAFFGITREVIEFISVHPQADRLEIAKCRGLGFQMVVPKGMYQVGQEVLYIPVDSLLPRELSDQLGVTKFLAGAQHNRVKTVQLRLEPSQGILADPAILISRGIALTAAPEEITSALGVTKYEPPIKITSGGNLVPLPPGISIYDIEGAERVPEMYTALLDQPVVITEKLEGTNISVYINLESGETFINQRSNAIVCAPGEMNSYCETAVKAGMVEAAKTLRSLLPKEDQFLAIYGEMLGPGINGNIYEFKDLQIRIYDMRILRHFFPWQQMREFALQTGLPLVPVISEGPTLREWLAGRTLVQASSGLSAINPKTLREGVVIKPLQEQRVRGVGRLIIKQRDPVYLAKTGN